MPTSTAATIFTSIKSLSASTSTASSLRGDIENIRACFFHLLIVCTLIVAVGVVIEGIKHLLSTGKPYVDAETGVFHAAPLREFRDSLERIGWLLVIVGVIGEGVFEMETTSADSMLQEFNNTLLAITTDRANTAERKASQGRAWALHLRPRYTSFDHKKFVQSLKGVPPQKVDVLYKPESEEAYTLAFAIVIALGLGNGNIGWNVTGPRPVTEKDASVLRNEFRIGIVPLIMRAGGSGGCGLIANPATDVSAIREALANSRSFGQIQTASSEAIPRGVIRIVIGEQFN